MAIPMSAQQVTAELQRKKNLGIAPTSLANQAQYKAMKPTTPLAATPKPNTGGVVPPTTSKPVTPVAATPQAAKPNVGGVVPQMNATTNTKGATPTLGYGGTSYGSSAAASQGVAANQTALKNTPGFKDSEIARTQSVIEQRKAQGLDTSAQEKYLNVNLGYSAQQATPKINMPMPDAVTNVRSSSDLQQSAGDQNAIERASLQTAVNSQLQSLKNNAGYANQLTQDNRVLEDLNFNRVNDPAAIDGSTGYRGAMLDRGRQIDDTYTQVDLTNRLNTVQQDLYNFDKLAPERQRQIYNEMLQMERDFGLQQGALTGNYASGRTLAGQAQDWGQTVDEATLTGNFNGQKTAQQTQQEWQNRFAYGNAIGQFGNGQQTIENKQFQEGVRQDNRNFEYTQGRDARKDAEWDVEFNRIKEQDGIQNAIAWANQSLNTAEFEDRSAQGWAGLDFDMQNAGGQEKSTFTPNQVYSAIEQKYSNFFKTDSYGDIKTPTASDYESMYQDVIGYGLPEAQENDILRGIGMSDSQIAAFDKKYLSGN